VSRRQVAVVLVLVTAVAAGTVALLAPRADPFCDDDSTEYIEAGRNFAQGRGFVTWPYGAEGFGEEFVSLTSFPPGFPFLVAIGVRLGASAPDAATWIPRLFFVALPLLLYAVLRSVLGRAGALAAAVISSFTPSVAYHAMCALSDVPFLAAVLLGFLALFRGVRSARGRWVLLAGVLAGLATAIRNAGYAIPAAVVAALVLGGEIRRLPHYLLGYAAGYAPVVVRNLRAFGTLQPYDMPPSGASVATVLREALRSFDDMFVAHTLPWPVLVPALGGLVVVTAVLLLRAGTWRHLLATRHDRVVAGLVLFLYAAAGTCMILLTRMRFAVDTINPRFLIQYHWVFVAWCVLLAGQALRAFRVTSTRARIARAAGVAAVAGVLLAPQVRLARERARDMSWSLGMAAEHAGLCDVIASLPDDACLAAFRAPPLHMMYRRPVYQLPAVTPAEASAFVGDGRPFVVILFPSDREEFRDWQGVFDGRLPAGFRVIGRSGRVVALERPRSGG
jgi:4-amino-4-deoxy-L-arabinose transferase-like glycosyltransferase